MSLWLNTILKIFLVMASAILLVGVLAWVALKPLNMKNGFKRSFIINELQILDIARRPTNVTGIVSATSNSIYFKSNDPRKLYSTSIDLENGKNIDLDIRVNSAILSAFTVAIDSPNISIMAGNAPVIITGNLQQKVFTNYTFPGSIFTRAVKLSNTTYAFRGFDVDSNVVNPVFIKGNPTTRVTLKSDFLINRNNDAGLSSDGILNFDPGSALLTYVSFYDNTFYCLDTNLNIVYTGRTIDTLSTVTTTTSNTGMKNSTSITNSQPMRVVNNKSCVHNGYLYNASRIKADNEAVSDFNRNLVIDTYRIRDGKYLGSFYIMSFKNEKFIDFKVIPNRIIVVYKDHIVSYGFNYS